MTTTRAEVRAAPPGIPAYVDYRDSEFVDEFLADMRRPSPLEQIAPRGRVALRYDLEKHDLRPWVVDRLRDAEILDGEQAAALRLELADLHQHVPASEWRMDESQQCAAGRALYEMPHGFDGAYRAMLAEVIAALPIDGAPFHVQRTPNFRVFFPRAEGYRDVVTFHNDIMIGHNPREWNVFVPLVPCADSRSLLIADLDDSMELLADYGADLARFGRDVALIEDVAARCHAICSPLEVEVGEAVLFDPRCIHAGPPNTTEQTRVTMDTRLLGAGALATQRARYRGLGRRRARFEPGPGGYFTAETFG